MGIIRTKFFLCIIIPAFICEGCGQSDARVSTRQIASDEVPGDRLEIVGKIVNESGEPVSGARLFFYQANSEGEYDSDFLGMPSFARIRGTVYTDEQGSFRLKTIIPGNYPGESDGKHIHVEASAKGFSEWKFELLFEGWVSESLRKEIAENGDGIIIDPQEGENGEFLASVLIELREK